MDILSEGLGEYKPPRPDDMRDWVRTHKERKLVDKTMTEREAISRFVADGDYLAYDLSAGCRGPLSLMFEIMRQQKKDLWLAAKFSFYDATLMVAAGCCSRVDVGWMETGRVLNEGVRSGKVKFIEWTNGALAYRLLAGAMGVPFLPMRYMGGTDTFTHSGAKLVNDPFTGDPIVLVPALNPDVGLVHAYQCDKYGNARIFGVGVAPQEVAMASKKLIISTEEIVDTAEIQSKPHLTTIPYYMVDAVVHAPFGAYPGAMPGLYAADTAPVLEFGMCQAQDRIEDFLQKWVYGVESHQDMLDKLVGPEKLAALRKAETIHEGYTP